MKVVITGGGGFIGSQLAKALLEKGSLIGKNGARESIDSVTLFDNRFPDEVKALGQQGHVPELTLLSGDIGDEDTVRTLIDRDDISVFHLASMVSGECEKEFDEALRVNLDGHRFLLEALREKDGAPRIVFASSVAVFGGAAMTDPVSDSTKQTPQTTYGMTKSMGEAMINDYSRKGFLDGRAARLPTVIVRPGKPNAAASSWASGMFREPLAGETCYLPVHRDQLHPVIGYRDVVNSFIALHEADPERLGTDRAFVLPSHRISVNEAMRVLQQVGEEKRIDLGMVIDEPDPVIQGIVDTWPTATNGTRAVKIGVPEPRSLADILRDYIDDFVTA